MINKYEFLNPKFLNYFLVVADKGSILAASKDLRISQPSITRSIKIIEFNLKKKIFSRGKKGIQLTQEGQILYAFAKKREIENQKIVTSIKSNTLLNQDKVKNQITIGFPSTLSTLHKDHFIWFMKDGFKDKRLKVVETNSFDLIKLIKNNKINYAISTLPQEEENIIKDFLFEDVFCVAFSKGHKFEKSKKIKLKDVQSESNYVFRDSCEFIYYKTYNEKNEIINKQEFNNLIDIRKKNRGHADVIYTENENTSSTCIKQGLGVGIIPESIAQNNALIYKPIDEPKISRQIYLIRNKNTPLFDINLNTLKKILSL
ncbi:LysR family transcriptional regulator [Candidatus Pelagibacter sp.]|uniref:LysR family transcriptional regulator n=1 Tax=Candidatus Pelagibacter sp. TaxID=2024849 RepID=UPI003F87D808